MVEFPVKNGLTVSKLLDLEGFFLGAGSRFGCGYCMSLTRWIEGTH